MLASPSHLVVDSTSVLSLPDPTQEELSWVPHFTAVGLTHTQPTLTVSFDFHFRQQGRRWVPFVVLQTAIPFFSDEHQKSVAPTLYSKPSTDFSLLL